MLTGEPCGTKEDAGLSHSGKTAGSRLFGKITQEELSQRCTWDIQSKWDDFEPLYNCFFIKFTKSFDFVAFFSLKNLLKS